MIFIMSSYLHTEMAFWGCKTVFEIRTSRITFVPV